VQEETSSESTESSPITGESVAPDQVGLKEGAPSPKGKTIYIDPYNIKEDSEKADIILLTHSHYDHCSFGDMNKIVKEGTIVFAPADCQSNVTRFQVGVDIKIAEPGQEFDFGN